jgi:hypothetical protein
MIPKNYYTYILFKTYKTGKFTYQDLQFEMEPFYVGKGKNDRLDKSKKGTTSTNKHKANVIEKIHRENLTVTSIKFKEDISEEESFRNEMELIAKIGRKDLGMGPLVNLTNGGEDHSGFIMLESSKKLLRDIFKGRSIPEFFHPIVKYDLDGNFIKEYSSIKEAEIEHLIEPGKSNISYVCSGARDTTLGYIWKYKENYDNTNKIDTSKLKNRSHKGNFPVKVNQYDLDGNLIEKFNSIKEASEKTCCSESKIVIVCRGKRQKTKGYIFKYERD